MVGRAVRATWSGGLRTMAAGVGRHERSAAGRATWSGGLRTMAAAVGRVAWSVAVWAW